MELISFHILYLRLLRCAFRGFIPSIGPVIFLPHFIMNTISLVEYVYNGFVFWSFLSSETQSFLYLESDLSFCFTGNTTPQNIFVLYFQRSAFRPQNPPTSHFIFLSRRFAFFFKVGDLCIRFFPTILFFQKPALRA